MKILGILLLGLLTILILIFGILACEIWSVLQIYNRVTDVASLKNLRKIQRIALWLVNQWKNRRSTVILLLLILIFTGCHGGGVVPRSSESDSIPEKPDPRQVLTQSGEKTWLYYADFYIIDSCEYVHVGDCWVHKGNCKFCKKRRDEEINRIINALARP